MPKTRLELIERLKALARPIVEGEGLELVELEFQRERGGWILRLYIDREGGVSLDDCEVVSRQLGDLLDVEDLIDHPYSLEVSSPGLDRPLSKETDLHRFAGRTVRITTYQPVEGLRKFVGRLLSYRDGQVILQGDDGSVVEIPYTTVAKARLEVEF